MVGSEEKLMRTAYLHGLESAPGGEKVEFLKIIGNTYAPEIDYKSQGIYHKLLKEIQEFKPELIIGSSMGGYVGYLIGNETDTNTVLFNPALAYTKRSVHPDGAPLYDYKLSNSAKHRIIIGGVDDVVNPIYTFPLILQDKVRCTLEIDPQLGHRIPYEKFIEVVGDEIRKHSQ